MKEIISRGPPSAVTYDISDPFQTTITLPTGSTWSSELHWHEKHTEYLFVVKGSVRVHLGGKTRMVSSEDGEVRVDRFVWHEWSRASLEGEEVVVVERTDPADGEKQLFFRNLNAVILRAQRARKPPLIPAWLFGAVLESWILLHLCIVFQRFDNFPVFFNFPGRLLGSWSTLDERFLTHRLLSRSEFIWTHLALQVLFVAGQLFRLDSAKRDFNQEEVSQLLLSSGARKDI